MANVRRDFLHKFTTRISKNHAEILVEDLHVKAMVQNRHLARAIHDVGWSEIGGNWSISRFCTDRS